MNGNWFDRLRDHLWRSSPHGRYAAPAIRVLRFLYAVIRDLMSGHLTLQAAGLVYVTILSIVPVLAISFSVVKAFGFHRQMRPLIENLFQPLGDQAQTVTDGIIRFVDNAQGNVLAGIGLALLFVTTVSMAQRIEGGFNHVWHVDRPRNLARRISDYLTVILLGPVVMITAMGIIATLESTTLLQRLLGIPHIAETVALLGRAVPYVLIWVTFGFVYWFVPNTRVKVRAAVIGALVGGTLWAALGVVFARFVATSSQTATIYATFAIVITSLIWLYLCWLVLLLGAQVAFYVQHPAYLRIGYGDFPVSGRQREQMALAVMLYTAGAFRSGAPHPTVDSIATATGMPAAALSPVLARLETAGLLIRSEKDELLPNRDPAMVRLREVLAAVREPLERDVLPAGHWPDAVTEIMARVDGALDASLGEETLASLVEVRAPPGG